MPEYRILIYGYGNPGRQDDGLGNAFVERMEQWVRQQAIEDIEFDSNYQLNIEDSIAIADKDLVIFVDASVEEEIDDFALTRVKGTSDVAFTTHAASPGYVFKLCQDLYNKSPATLLLHIKGYEWSFTEGLTDAAEKNLEAAMAFLKEKLGNPEELINYVETENK